MPEIEVKKDESFESALRRFKKKLSRKESSGKSGTVSTMRNPVRKKERGQREEDNNGPCAFYLMERLPL